MIGPLLDALEYLHACNLVHRDVKLENVLKSEGAIKLCDFGELKTEKTARNTNRPELDTTRPRPITDRFIDRHAGREARDKAWHNGLFQPRNPPGGPKANAGRVQGPGGVRVWTRGRYL